jgi:hypothetical protein
MSKPSNRFRRTQFVGSSHLHLNSPSHTTRVHKSQDSLSSEETDTKESLSSLAHEESGPVLKGFISIPAPVVDDSNSLKDTPSYFHQVYLFNLGSQCF